MWEFVNMRQQITKIDNKNYLKVKGHKIDFSCTVASVTV